MDFYRHTSSETEYLHNVSPTRTRRDTYSEPAMSFRSSQTAYDWETLSRPPSVHFAPLSRMFSDEPSPPGTPPAHLSEFPTRPVSPRSEKYIRLKWLAGTLRGSHKSDERSRRRIREERPKSNRPSAHPNLPSQHSSLFERYIEGLSDSRRLTLLKFLIEQTSRLDSHSLRRPGRKVPIISDDEMMHSYEESFLKLTKVFSPHQRSFINNVLSNTKRPVHDEDTLQEIDQCIAIITQGIKKSRSLQRSFRAMAERQVKII